MILKPPVQRFFGGGGRLLSGLEIVIKDAVGICFKKFTQAWQPVRPESASLPSAADVPGSR